MGGVFRLCKAVSLKMCFSFGAQNHLFVNIKDLAKGVSLLVNLFARNFIIDCVESMQWEEVEIFSKGHSTIYN